MGRRYAWRWYAILVTLIVGLVILACAVHPLWLPAFAAVLSVEDPLQPADVIIVLGGGTGTRLEYAVKLYKEGYAPRLLLTSGPIPVCNPLVNGAIFLREKALQLGVSPGDIVLEEESTSTYEDAVYSKEIMSGQGWTSAIIVTDFFHARRAMMTFRAVFADEDIKFISSPSMPPDFGAGDWWMKERGLIEIWSEYIKLFFYLVNYGIRPL